MYNPSFIFTVLVTVINSIYCKSVELTFELPDNAVECFYHEIEKDVSASLEYQVLLSYIIYLYMP